MARNPILIFHGGMKPMEISSTYNVNFPANPHSVILKYSTRETRDQMLHWCGEMFGAHTKQWRNPRWHTDDFDTRFHFKNEADAALFVMRWS